jgi:hypothetical protein
VRRYPASRSVSIKFCQVAGASRSDAEGAWRLAFAEFKGYETWEVVAVSNNQKTVAVILANPVMIAAYKAGIPANGKPVPRRRQDGQGPLDSEEERVLPGHDDSRRPARRRLHGQGQQALRKDGGWGYAVFDYDAATDTFSPGTTADNPPQANDASAESPATRS